MVGSEGHDNFEFSRSPSGWEIITYFQCISQKKKILRNKYFHSNHYYQIFFSLEPFIGASADHKFPLFLICVYIQFKVRIIPELVLQFEMT